MQWSLILATVALAGGIAFLALRPGATSNLRSVVEDPAGLDRAVAAVDQSADPAAPAPEILPPLPAIAYTPPRPWPVVQAAYEFAARHPEVMRYVPCFCGCESSGHRHNEHCFVTTRDHSGQVTWNEHGLSCAICIDVAVQAREMHEAGASREAIRAEIERTYQPRFPTQTPTPPVPSHASN